MKNSMQAMIEPYQDVWNHLDSAGKDDNNLSPWVWRIMYRGLMMSLDQGINRLWVHRQFELDTPWGSGDIRGWFPPI